jgi:hypothetical protein
MIVIKVQSSKEKLNVSAETDLKQNQGFDSAVKLRLVIGFKLADYAGSYHTKLK